VKTEYEEFSNSHFVQNEANAKLKSQPAQDINARLLLLRTIRQIPKISNRSRRFANDYIPPEVLNRQLENEETQLYGAIQDRRETIKTLFKYGQGASIKGAQEFIMKWYEPFLNDISTEVEWCLHKETGNYPVRFVLKLIS
jgi:hypothetical protein